MLYASADRIAQRTGALLRARVTGRHAGDVIADLAHQAVGTNDVLVADLGCGRGTTTRMLADRLPAARVVAVDLSAALLAASKRRLAGSSRAGTVRADFHRLPFPDDSCGLVVAAFCLYHSSSPGSVIREITRCLLPGGTAIFAVKSADSYRGTRPASRRLWPRPRSGQPPEPVPGRPQRQHHRTRRREPERPAGHPRNPPLHLPGARRRSRVPGDLTEVRPAASLWPGVLLPWPRPYGSEFPMRRSRRHPSLPTWSLIRPPQAPP